MSFSVNDSIRETEQNNFNFSNNSEHNIQNRFSMKKNSKLPRPNLKRRQNIVGEEQQQAILNIAYMYNQATGSVASSGTYDFSSNTYSSSGSVTSYIHVANSSSQQHVHLIPQTGKTLIND